MVYRSRFGSSRVLTAGDHTRIESIFIVVRLLWRPTKEAADLYPIVMSARADSVCVRVSFSVMFVLKVVVL